MSIKKDRMILGGLAACALLLVTQATPAEAKNGKQPRAQGIVQARPAGKAGQWVIGGKAFVVTAATQLDQAEGALSVGACAKVTYRVVNGITRAIEIDSEPASDC